MINEFDGYGDVLWTPSVESCKASNLTSFVRFLHSKTGIENKSWSQLHQWSVDSFPEFWAQLAAFYGLQLAGPAYDQDEWFPNAQLNFAKLVLQGYEQGNGSLNPKSDEAIVSISESGVRTSLTWHELHGKVLSIASYLKGVGVEPGDRVAGVLPNQAEAVIAALATAYIGGVWTSCSPDFGLAALDDRLSQTQPKVLFACEVYFYKGKSIVTTDTISQLVNQLPSIAQLVVTSHAVSQGHNFQGCADINQGCRLAQLDKVIDLQHIYNEYQVAEIEPVNVSFRGPLYIMYSSGTTGKPKCIVHSVGGTLLQHLKELGLHTDIKPGEKLFYFSTCGWMMWNWLLSGLSVGATLYLFDGNPLYPTASRLLELAAAEKITHFGASAKYYGALSQAKVSGQSQNLSSIRSFLSTGSPLLPEVFDYIYQDLKADVRVASISGGTDIISCFALGNPWLPVRRGELQGPGLGMNVKILNDKAEQVVGEKGELVCTTPFPSQPIGFWNDPNQERYKKAYFSRFKGIWAQGDYALMSKFGGFIIFGRSDAVLNPGGVRIGTAEIYRQVEQLEEVVDCVAVGKKIEDDEEIWLFVQLPLGQILDDDLENKIRTQIRSNTSPRHVPSRITAVPDIPKTRSGKIAELAVKKMIHGEFIDNQESLVNPGSLEYFKIEDQ